MKGGLRGAGVETSRKHPLPGVGEPGNLQTAGATGGGKEAEGREGKYKGKCPPFPRGRV